MNETLIAYSCNGKYPRYKFREIYSGSAWNRICKNVCCISILSLLPSHSHSFVSGTKEETIRKFIFPIREILPLQRDRIAIDGAERIVTRGAYAKRFWGISVFSSWITPLRLNSFLGKRLTRNVRAFHFLSLSRRLALSSVGLANSRIFLNLALIKIETDSRYTPRSSPLLPLSLSLSLSLFLLFPSLFLYLSRSFTTLSRRTRQYYF